MDWVPWVKVVIAFAVMLSASLSDWRVREAGDGHWIVLGTAGFLFLLMDMWGDSAEWFYYMMITGTAILFYDIFWDRPGVFEDGVQVAPLALNTAAIVMIGFSIWSGWGDAYLYDVLVVPVMFAVFIFLYQIDVIKGGADAKALISLAVLFPTYPVIGNLPLIVAPSELAMQVFPFSLVILFNGALMIAFLPLVFLAINVMNGEMRFPLMLFGYRVPMSEAMVGHQWPMEYIEDGEVRTTLFPRADEEDQFAPLEGAGMERVWVTPKIPFLIPLTASLLFSLIVGNVLFLLL